MEFKRPILVVVCGWPASGKTTIASALSKELEIRHLDIDDDIRFPIFGPSNPHPDKSDGLMKIDREEMAASYELLLRATDIYLRLGRSLVITATFSRKQGQIDLSLMLQKHPNVNVAVIWCRPQSLTEHQVEIRLTRRPGVYRGSVTTLKRYHEVKCRFNVIELPHLDLDTSAQDAIEDCIQRALEYVISEPGFDPFQIIQ